MKTSGETSGNQFGRPEITSGSGEIATIPGKLEAIALLAETLGPEGFDFAAALRAVIAGGGTISLDEAFGVTPQPGQRRWVTEARLARRDHFLRKAAAAAGAKAPELAKMVAAYASRAWPRDRQAPPSYEEPARAYLYRAFAEVDGRVPASTKQLRRILKGH